MSWTPARVLVVGGGAIGGVTAAHLQRAGRDVVVLDANEEHVRLLNEPGLHLDHLGEELVVPLRAVSSADQLEGRFDFALLTLKAAYLEPAVTSLLKTDLVDTYVCFGNGLVQDQVETLVGRERLLVGITEWGGTNLGPGHLAQTTIAPFVVGQPGGGTSSRLQALELALAPVAEVRVSPDISRHVWSKLLLNSTFSGLGAVCGGLYADVVGDPLGRRVAYALWTEGRDVAVAAGIELDPILGVDPERIVVHDVADELDASVAVDEIMRHLAATRASMLQDLERGALTEVDVINGGVVVTAGRLGVPAPGNAAVVDFVHACERGEQNPSRAAFARIADALGVDR